MRVRTLGALAVGTLLTAVSLVPRTLPRRFRRRRSAARCQVRRARKRRHATIPLQQPAQAESAAGWSQPTRLRPCGARKYVSPRWKFASTNRDD